MKHISTFLFLGMSVFLFAFSPVNVFAASYGLTKSFGGRVYLAPIPGITCNGVGTLMLLNSNANSALRTLGSAGQLNQNSAQKLAQNVYSAIPTYTTDAQKSPQPMKQILGRQNLTPDMNTCYIPTPAGPVYIPVLRTTPNYNVSR
ncbi:MAG: hypothetical protein KBB75_00640 [Candidatus Pacebacteria bacterium]|jgi:polyhydroxyalkanoate synthesis regulator phasin|nr:hypothetical protein [Candidatus Paceibacterota bacterium]